MSAEFSGPTSYYDTVMDMCLPCNSLQGNQCVFAPTDNDQTWIMRAARKGGMMAPQRRYRADGAPEPYPPCSGDGITNCYFQEDGDAPSDVDVCYDAVFGGSDEGVLPPPDWEGNVQPYNPPYSAGMIKPSAAVAQARLQQCPFYVCAAQTYRSGNGVVAFDHSSCKCAGPQAARAVRK